MSVFITDPTATLKSTTFENALYELLTLVRTYELKLATDPNLIDFTINNDFLFSGSFIVPVISSVNSTTGAINILGVDYLGNLTYSQGVSANTLMSTNVIAALVELMQSIQLIETNTAKNPAGVNNITFDTRSDGTSFQGTFSLTLIPTFNTDGSMKYLAKEYLL